jgi:ATP-dependent exoDNAse (exonuclease V) beta subunit
MPWGCVTDWVHPLPSQTKLIYPHQQSDAVGAQASGACTPAQVTFYKQRGIFLHKAMELRLKGEAFEAAVLWHHLVQVSADIKKETSWQEASCQEAMAEVEAAFESADLQALLQDAQGVYPELHFCHPLPQGLVRGTMDLMIVTPTQVWVIDYKSDSYGQAQPVFYDKQLRYYGSAAQAMFPHHKIHTRIFSLKQARFLETV